MLRRSASVLSLCRSLPSASNSSRLAEKLPVPVAVPAAFQAVVPSPLQNWAQSAWLLKAESACFFHTNHVLREVDLNYRYGPGFAATKQSMFDTDLLLRCFGASQEPNRKDLASLA